MKSLKFKEYPQKQFPVGLVVNGKIIKEFDFSPMTGKLHREVLNCGTGGNIKKMIPVLLQGIIKRIGDFENPPLSMIERLTLVDNEYLLFYYNSEYEATGRLSKNKITCKACKREMEFSFNYDDADIKYLPTEEIVFDGERVYVEHSGNVNSYYLTTFKDSDGYKGDRKDSDAVEYFLLSQAIRDYKGKKWTPQEIENLPKTEIDELVVATNLLTLGPDIKVKVKCPNELCLTENKTEIDLLSFFYATFTEGYSNLINEQVIFLITNFPKYPSYNLTYTEAMSLSHKERKRLVDNMINLHEQYKRVYSKR